MRFLRKPIHLIALAAALFYTAFIAGTSFVIGGVRYFTLIDDAMISMRYARHLAQGYGLVWNIGGAPAQGFTNLGWTLWMAALHLLPISTAKISLAVMLSSAAILIVNLYVVDAIAKSLLPESPFAATLAALSTAFYFPLVFWSLRGMEVGLLVLLIDLAVLLALRESPRPIANSILLALALTLAVIVRVDAVLSAAVVVAFFFTRQKRAALLPAAVLILATAAVFFFQHAYYGDYLPTTYYQKLTGFSLSVRVQHGLLVFNEYAARDTLPLFLISLAALIYYRKLRDARAWMLLLIFLIQCAYSVYVGGDYAEPETNAANRFITQGMPALILLFSWMAALLQTDLEAGRRAATFSSLRVDPALVVGVITLCVISGTPWASYAIDNAPLLKADIRRVRIGLHIAEYSNPQAVIAVHAAGQIPYFSDRPTIDLLGLNDAVIAKGPAHGAFYPGHNKWDYRYSITKLQPDVIADNFAPLIEFLHDEPEYQQLENGIYVRSDSTLIDAAGMAKEFRFQ